MQITERIKMRKSVEYQNKMYPSLKALYSYLIESGCTEIPYQVFYYRYCAGWDVEQILSVPVNEVCKRDYIVGDKVFPSLKDLAKAAEISYDAAVKRRNRGFTDFEIFYGKKVHSTQKDLLKRNQSKTEESRRKDAEIILKGQSFKSLAEAYYRFKPAISMNSFRGRLRLGWSAEEALGLVEKTDGRCSRKIVIDIDNILYDLKDAAAKFKVSAQTIRSRMLRGATYKQAVGIEQIHKGDLLPNMANATTEELTIKKNIVYQGVQYNSLASLAKAYGLDQRLLYNRLHRNKWSLEKAMETPVRGQVIVAGQAFKSDLEAFEKIGRVSFANYMIRRTRKHPIEVCLGLEPMPRTIKQKTKKELVEIAGSNNLSYIQLSKRLKEMTLDEALKHIPVIGKYNHAVFARKPQLANSRGYLYFVTLNTPEGILYKIGITKRLATRFRSKQINSVKAIIQGKLIDVYTLEQRILKEFSDSAYKADKCFEGRTETLLLDDLEEIMMLDLLENEVKNNPTVFQFSEV
jgi:hypothetical protein